MRTSLPRRVSSGPLRRPCLAGSVWADGPPVARPRRWLDAKGPTVAVVLAGVLGCHGNVNGPGVGDVEVSEPFLFQMDAAAASGLTLEGVNGEVTIVGDLAMTVARIEGRRRVRSNTRADALDFLGRLSVEVLDEGDTIAVRTRQPNQTGGRSVIVDYEVTVPQRMAVRVASANGDVSVEGLEGSVSLTHANGQLLLARLVGDVEAALANGEIAADLAPPPGGVVDLRVVNGEIRLDVPVSVSAWLDASVVNGTISVVGLTIADGTTSTRSVRGRLGAGDGQIDLAVTNGTITLRGR